MAKCECGNSTNDKSGQCIICRLKIRAKDNTALKAGMREQKINQKKEESEGSEDTMAQLKTCECGKEFEPTSNRQKYCPDCKAAKKGTPQKKRAPKAPKQPPASSPPASEPEPIGEDIKDSFAELQTCLNCLHNEVCWLTMMVSESNRRLVLDGHLRGLCSKYRGE